MNINYLTPRRNGNISIIKNNSKNNFIFNYDCFLNGKNFTLNDSEISNLKKSPLLNKYFDINYRTGNFQIKDGIIYDIVINNNNEILDGNKRLEYCLRNNITPKFIRFESNLIEDMLVFITYRKFVYSYSTDDEKCLMYYKMFKDYSGNETLKNLFKYMDGFFTDNMLYNLQYVDKYSSILDSNKFDFYYYNIRYYYLKVKKGVYESKNNHLYKKCG